MTDNRPETLYPDQDYAAFLAQGRFMIQRVRGGGDAVFYPRVAQPGHGAALEWVEASGNGIVYSTTVVRNKPPTPDFNVALIDLEEGVRMMGRVIGVAPDAVTIGQRVRARVGVIDDAPAVVFDIVEGEA